MLMQARVREFEAREAAAAERSAALVAAREEEAKARARARALVWRCDVRRLGPGPQGRAAAPGGAQALRRGRHRGAPVCEAGGRTRRRPACGVAAARHARR